MRLAWTSVLAVLAFSPGVFSQGSEPAIKVGAFSAFVWGEDSPLGAVSSTIQDPLTGNAIHKLSYGGIEVSSGMGFESVGPEFETFLNYKTTVANSTESTLSVRYGGISVEGHIASPLEVIPPGKKLKKSPRKSKTDVVEFEKMHCLTTGFLRNDNFFSANALSQVLSVAPQTAMAISLIIRHPLSYHSLRCTVEGCYPIGVTRYYLNVEGHDFVFVWPGRSAVYCGKNDWFDPNPSYR